MGSIHTSGPILHDELIRALRIPKRRALLFLLLTAMPLAAERKKVVRFNKIFADL